MLLYEKYNYLPLLAFILVRLCIVQCYPTGSPSLLGKSDLKDESRFPNGTVVGNYNYIDKEGNPVQVKYYADDSSYGVELKSIKILDSNEMSSQPDKQQLKMENFWQPLDTGADFLTDYQNTNYSSNSNKSKYTSKYNFNEPNKDLPVIRESPYKGGISPDYEIYLQNELQTPNFGKDKVRIYIDKSKRKIREILNDVATFKYFI